jgi:hypothetical protein
MIEALTLNHSSSVCTYTYTHTIMTIFDGSRMISKLSLSKTTHVSSNLPVWNSYPVRPDSSIYEALNDDAFYSVVTSSIGEFIDSFAVLFLVNHVRQDLWLMGTFMALAVLFAIKAGTVFGTYQKNGFSATIVLYNLAGVFFNLGAC